MGIHCHITRKPLIWKRQNYKVLLLKQSEITHNRNRQKKSHSQPSVRGMIDVRPHAPLRWSARAISPKHCTQAQCIVVKWISIVGKVLITQSHKQTAYCIYCSAKPRCFKSNLPYHINKCRALRSWSWKSLAWKRRLHLLSHKEKDDP